MNEKPSPTPDRVTALVDHIYSLGAYTHAAEVEALGKERDNLRATLAELRELMESAESLTMAIKQLLDDNKRKFHVGDIVELARLDPVRGRVGIDPRHFGKIGAVESVGDNGWILVRLKDGDILNRNDGDILYRFFVLPSMLDRKEGMDD